MEDEERSSYVSANLSLKPGFCAQSYAFTADVGTDYFKLYLVHKNDGYDAKDAEVSVFESLYAGAYFDYVITRIHLNVDTGNKFYLAVKHDVAWHTWKADHAYDMATAFIEKTDDLEGNCLMPASNLDIRIGAVLRF